MEQSTELTLDMSMKIADIAFVALAADLPAGKAYGMAKALATSRQSTLVRLTLEDGTEGVGEAWGMPSVNLAYLPFVKGYLVGTSVFDVEHAFSRILARHYHFGVQGPLMACISGIDMAAKDAMGKLLDLPVHRLIGGKRWDEVPVYASGGYITEHPERDFEPQIAAMAEAGHRAVKIKIGLSPNSDAERVRAARRLLGPEVDLMVDINSNYTFDLARESIARIAEHSIGWVRTPGLRRVRSAAAGKHDPGRHRGSSLHRLRLQAPRRPPRGRRAAAGLV